MIALAKLAGTVAKEAGGGIVQVPDLNLPATLNWSVSVTDHGVQMFTLERNGQSTTILLLGPYTIGSSTYYLIQGPKSRVFTFLRTRLGSANITPLIRALRARRSVRRWARAQGFRIIRNGSGNAVNVGAPLVICGRQPVDYDEDTTRENAPPLEDMEG